MEYLLAAVAATITATYLLSVSSETELPGASQLLPKFALVAATMLALPMLWAGGWTNATKIYSSGSLVLLVLAAVTFAAAVFPSGNNRLWFTALPVSLFFHCVQVLHILNGAKIWTENFAEMVGAVCLLPVSVFVVSGGILSNLFGLTVPPSKIGSNTLAVRALVVVSLLVHLLTAFCPDIFNHNKLF